MSDDAIEEMLEAHREFLEHLQRLNRLRGERISYLEDRIEDLREAVEIGEGRLTRLEEMMITLENQMPRQP